MGRKMKPGRRYAGGRLATGEYREADFGVPGSKVRKLIEKVMYLVDDPRIGNPLGLMAFCKEITEVQCEAGWRFAERHAAYAKAIDAPRSTPKSPDPNSSGKGAAGEETEQEEQTAIRAVTSHNKVLSALSKAGGLPLQRLTRSVCVEDATPTWDQKELLKQGLDVLCEEYGMVGGKPPKRKT